MSLHTRVKKASLLTTWLLVFDKQEERLKYLRRQRQRAPIFEEHPMIGIDPEAIEFKNALDPLSTMPGAGIEPARTLRSSGF